MGNDFDEEFMSDEEVEEVLDAFIDCMLENVDTETNYVSIIRPNRIQELKYTYKVLKYLTKGTSAKVTYDLHEPFKSMGSVSVIGKNLKFRKPEWFMKAVELSDSFDVFPRIDGTVQIDFTFHGLTRTIGQLGGDYNG